MTFIPLDEVEWREVGYLWDEGQEPDYLMVLPRPLADWDVWQHWERARVKSMEQHLTKGMTLFDVGTEQGWCNLVYASMVGPENMVLIEPTPEFWPNIRATWQKNYRKKPKACFQGLFSNKTTDDAVPSFGWPGDPNAPLIDRSKYQYIHENEGVPEITLDDFVEMSGVVPDAITIDVEGAELLVLRGAEWTLRKWHPKVWVSVHPDLGERDYGVTPDQVHGFMKSVRYRKYFLGEDHEQHWLYV